MPWIVKNLWLIPALPLLAAGLSALAHPVGTECREMVAHGVSHGYCAVNILSPVGAKESVAPSGAWFALPLNPTARAVGYHLSPLRG